MFSKYRFFIFELMVYLQRIILAFVFLISANISALKAQSISLDETIKFINSKLSPSCKVDVKNGELLAEFYDKNGNLIRKDRADIDHLVPEKTMYSAEQKMIIVFCEEDDCVERKLLGNTRVTRLYDRYPFVWEGEQKIAESIVKAFNHLIRTINEKGYKNNSPFE
jgi:hypothetical protein